MRESVHGSERESSCDSAGGLANLSVNQAIPRDRGLARARASYKIEVMAHRSWTVALAGAWIALFIAWHLGGCRGSGGTAGTEPAPSSRRLTPRDFAAAPPAPDARPDDNAEDNADAVALSPLDAEPDDEAATRSSAPASDEDALFDDAAPTPTAEQADIDEAEASAVDAMASRAPRARVEANPAPIGSGTDAYTMDAMVGQVNGRAIYANAVLEPLADQLAALGRTLDPATFRRRAGELIAARLDQIITDALILGEAERDLNEAERFGLRVMMQRRREELLRQYGRGSRAMAEEAILRETGQTLDQNLEVYRQQQLVRRYLMQKLLPLINISRRDVERHYKDHLDTYQPKARRTIRMIRAARSDDAEAIAGMLAEGKPFAQIASSRLNGFNPAAGGLYSEPVVGDGGFGGELGQAIATLDEGQHAGPFTHNNATWFVHVDKLERGEGRPLREVQLDIERELRINRFRFLSQRYRQRLYAEGSYNEVDQMVRALTEVAVSRYAAAR